MKKNCSPPCDNCSSRSSTLIKRNVTKEAVEILDIIEQLVSKKKKWKVRNSINDITNLSRK